jgi:hypothetical protein
MYGGYFFSPKSHIFSCQKESVFPYKGIMDILRMADGRKERTKSWERRERQ